MMTLDSHLVDELLKHYKTPEDLIGESGLLKQLTVALLERALSVAMDEPAGRAVRDPAVQDHRFDLPLVTTAPINLTEYDDKIVALYARGLSTPEIQTHLQEIYGAQVSPIQINSVTDALIDEASAWQSRPLERLYPIMYFDTMLIKCCENAQIKNKPVHLAIGVNPEGIREVLGLWMGEVMEPSFWFSVLNEIRNRGVQDIFIACVDGQNGFPEAINVVFPNTVVQLCIAHIVRRSLSYVPARSRKAVVEDLKRIYAATDAVDAERQLDAFAEKWDGAFAAISQLWRRNWERVTPFFAYPEEIRKVIYTTNAIELVNMNLRKVTNNRASFPNDEVILKSFHLALCNIAMKRTMPIRDWKTALNRFAILFESRMPVG